METITKFFYSNKIGHFNISMRAMYAVYIYTLKSFTSMIEVLHFNAGYKQLMRALVKLSVKIK